MRLLDTIFVEDNSLSLDMLTELCGNNPNIHLRGCFSRPAEAIAFAEANRVDLAVLDVAMPDMDGIHLGQYLRRINPRLMLLYITGRDDCCIQAIKNNADFVMLKPFDKNTIDESLARASCLASTRWDGQIVVRTYGRFDVFVNGNAVHLSNAKAKELLALCIDHLGGEVTMEEAVDKLWPDKPYDDRVKRLYRKAVSNLKATLRQYTDREVFVNSRGSCHVKPECIQCDYFECVNRINSGNRTKETDDFFNNYMIDYPWTEETVARYYFS